jgi:GH24 family phage-related lysozyme (muramidase)
MPINRIAPTPRAKLALAGSAGAVALAVSVLITPWEGRELHAYLDRIAKPPVWTICEGDTKNVRPGMVETPAGCDKRLSDRINQEFMPGLRRCIPGFDDKPESWQAAMLSLAWNAGIKAACTSRAARYAIADQLHASCEAMTAFNKAGGRIVPGLVKRREMGDGSRIGEAELCVSGL